MRRLAISIAVVTIIAGFLSACTKNSPTAPNVPTQEMGKMSMGIDTTGCAEQNLASGQVTISKGSLTQAQTITIIDHAGSVTFQNLQVGTWAIAVQLFDEAGAEIYSGSSEASVVKNQTTVAHIRVNHNTGRLIVVVEVPGERNPTPTATPISTQGLVLWNKLGSTDEALHSAYGPNLFIYDINTGEGPDNNPGVYARGIASFVPGVFGNAAKIGSYTPESPTPVKLHVFV
jgi:hypothetical protein